MKKVLLLIFPLFVFAQSSFSFLNMPFIGKNSAAANIKSVISSGADNLFNNPSLLNKNIYKNHILFSYQRAYQDLNTYKLGYFTKYDSNLSFGTNILNSKIENIEIRTRPGEPQGKFDYNLFLTNIGTSYKIDKDLYVGLSLNYIYQTLSIDDESGYFVNMGLFYNDIIDKLSLGLYLNNYGNSNGLRNQKSKLPKTSGMGIVYQLTNIGNIGINTDYYYELEYNIVDKKGLNKIAIDIDYNRIMNVMIGYIINNEIYSFTYGFGITFGNINFYYSYLPTKYQMGVNNSLNLKINW
ncbi:MAG TPA: hypothetical protein PLI27_00885 [Ignavibacteriales bacterium]|nr:hypothetical protein [Ignavibacteriales bacterium]HOL80241.1 hypothetical protein [Ignavibacteriales bacterium]HOM64522.1 hypothetical protein [Ignavibacteriales bacterium]HPD66619.1 hypothetical protein [Ignavibacteriales bacterium]HPP32430.1 hypothetical protein [Ignavibacteriales bacterium]